MSGAEEITVQPGEAGARLDRWLKRRFPGLTQGHVEKWLRTGQVRVDGARARANQRVEEGQQVRVPPAAMSAEPRRDAGQPARVSAADRSFIQSLVLFEDEHMVALNKPAGLAVQGGSKTHRHVDALAAGLAKAGGEKPRLAHRLDRDTSGVLVLGKSPAATAKLARTFAAHTAIKTYWALTMGVPTPGEGLIKGFLRKGAGAKGGGDREIMVAARHGDPGAVYARTLYTVVERAGARASWVALRPQTGRTHQLRVHMAMLGTSIIGDRKYTCDREPPGGLAEGLHLHARELTVPHPSGRGDVTLTAPMPEHMLESFAKLGFDPEAPIGDVFADA